jgi:hypothetical protein
MQVSYVFLYDFVLSFDVSPQEPKMACTIGTKFSSSNRDKALFWSVSPSA